MLANLIQTIAITAPPFLLAITFHEFCHGYVAWSLGDPTAHAEGRLTMNPLKHIDPIGLLAVFIIRTTCVFATMRAALCKKHLAI